MLGCSFELCLAVCSIFAFAPSPVQADSEKTDPRLLAAWKILQDDGLGDVYYFYPDGLFVCQGVRRREFVTIGRWKLEAANRLVMFERDVPSATFSEQERATLKASRTICILNFPGDGQMLWNPNGEVVHQITLRRISGLPDRTENIYW